MTNDPERLPFMSRVTVRFLRAFPSVLNFFVNRYTKEHEKFMGEMDAFSDKYKTGTKKSTLSTAEQVEEFKRGMKEP